MVFSFRQRDFFRNPVIILAALLIYGELNKLMSGFLLPGAEFISIRPQLIIPVTFSLLAGPWIGGLIGLTGNLFGDMLSGFHLQFWHWSIANFLIGFIPGLVHWIGIREIRRVNDFGLVLLFIFMGNLVGMFLGFLVHMLLNNMSFSTVMLSWYLPALISNTYLLMLLMPPVLALLHFLKLNIETRSMFFVLFFSMAIVTLLSVVFLISESQVFAKTMISDKKEILQKMILTHFHWIGMLLILIVIAAGSIGYYFSRKYMHPLYQLAEASNKLKSGNWDKTDMVDPVKNSDFIGNLIGVFNEMAAEIRAREMKMKNTIRELELRIDKTREDRILSEITETDFFRDLEKKSAELRRMKRKGFPNGKKRPEKIS
jgi:MFS family permease